MASIHVTKSVLIKLVVGMRTSS